MNKKKIRSKRCCTAPNRLIPRQEDLLVNLETQIINMFRREKQYKPIDGKNEFFEYDGKIKTVREDIYNYIGKINVKKRDLIWTDDINIEGLKRQGIKNEDKYLYLFTCKYNGVDCFKIGRTINFITRFNDYKNDSQIEFRMARWSDTTLPGTVQYWIIKC